jgi:hypothetical protein
MVNPSPTTALRWRARLSKEAVLGDDSSLISLPSDNKKDYGTSSACFSTLPHGHLLTLLAAATVGCHVYSLQIIRTWLMAVTCTLAVALSILTIYQRSRLRRLGSMRRQVNGTRRSVRSLKAQNERMYRTLQQLDHSVDRLHQIQSELNRFLATRREDPEKLLAVAQQWKEVQEDMFDMLQQQVQQTIVKAVLDTDRDANYVLSGPEFEQLVVRLGNIPGVKLHETALREFWVRVDDKSLATMLSLLRRVMQDAQEQRQQQEETGGDDQSTVGAVFTFKPRQLFKTGNTQGNLLELSEC